jgi:hypothetical protein
MKKKSANILLCLFLSLYFSIVATAADCNLVTTEKVSFEVVSDLVSRCNLNSVEQLMKLLPESYRSQYTLAY